MAVNCHIVIDALAVDTAHTRQDSFRLWKIIKKDKKEQERIHLLRNIYLQQNIINETKHKQFKNNMTKLMTNCSVKYM